MPEGDDGGDEGDDDDGPKCVRTGPCYLNTYDTDFKKVRGLCEVLLVFFSVFYLVTAAMEASHLGIKLFMKTLALCPSRCD